MAGAAIDRKRVGVGGVFFCKVLGFKPHHVFCLYILNPNPQMGTGSTHTHISRHRSGDGFFPTREG